MNIQAPLLWVACLRKKKYGFKTAKELGTKYKQQGYKCPYCGGWHLTKKLKPEVKKVCEQDIRKGYLGNESLL